MPGDRQRPEIPDITLLAIVRRRHASETSHAGIAETAVTSFEAERCIEEIQSQNPEIKILTPRPPYIILYNNIVCLVCICVCVCVRACVCACVCVCALMCSDICWCFVIHV